MRAGPFEYRPPRDRANLGDHRQKLLRTPLRVVTSSAKSDTDSELEIETSSIPSPVRNFECSNYETCLNLTAALNWQSFTCKGCSGEVNQLHLAKAAKAVERDRDLELLTGNLIGKK